MTHTRPCGCPASFVVSGSGWKVPLCPEHYRDSEAAAMVVKSTYDLTMVKAVLGETCQRLVPVDPVMDYAEAVVGLSCRPDGGDK